MSEGADRNEIVLVGRLSAEPTARELPSGDAMTAFRLVVRRPEGHRASRVGFDTLDCAAWRADVRRTVGRWRRGDVVEVSGSLRRRFWRAGGIASSAWEIEVAKARRVSRP
jgi:single-strand DNA-binding protein